jgi:thiamine biosynthesis lipoprotein
MAIQLHALRTHETRFRAMGTEVHVMTVEGDATLVDFANARILELEQRWSRFLETSEVSRLNRHAGLPQQVSPDTYELVSKAVTAWRATHGLFDPTLGRALSAHGYDRDFPSIITGTLAPEGPVSPCPTPAGIELAPILRAITLPVGVSFDPGGIGKGLAADLTATALHEAGAAGALVNVGGDLRVVGEPPSPEGWALTVPDPIHPGAELLRVGLHHGAVATSSRLLRRWRTSVGEAHHLIDPRTGRPADTDVVAVTVMAGEAWWAEAWTKALFLRGPSSLTTLGDIHAVIVTADGTRHATPHLEATLR